MAERSVQERLINLVTSQRVQPTLIPHLRIGLGMLTILTRRVSEGSSLCMINQVANLVTSQRVQPTLIPHLRIGLGMLTILTRRVSEGSSLCMRHRN